ncbi:MAG: M28 family peptidase, partial [Bacteroidetes bacterium]|nr:M28 family peptidase [Bacteroidota bacterium]
MNAVKVFFGFLVLLASTLPAQNEPPQVDQIQMTVSASEETITVDYRVDDKEGDEISVYLRISQGGEHYERPPEGLSGDVGENVAPGNNQIIWNYPSTLDPRMLSYQLSVWDDHPIDVQDMVNQVDSQRLERRLRALEGVRHYIQNPQGLSDMRDTIQAHFDAANLNTYSQLFNFQGTEGVNLIGKKAGLLDAQNVWIMDGHYDSVSGSPGADDNASAVVGMLECLEILADVPCKETINFIGFDFEEQGLVGSNRYATAGILESEEVQGVFNFEMIGYYSEEPNSQTLPFGFSQLFPEAAQEVESQEFRGNFLTNVGNDASADLIERLELAAESYVPALRVISLTVPGNGGIVPDLRRSDHASFWDQGYPALMLTDGANFRNNNYHEPSDTAGTLDFTFMQRVTQATLAALVEAAQPVNGRSYEIESPVSYQHVHISPEAKITAYPNPASD